MLANGTPSNGASAPPAVAFTQTQTFDGGHVTLHITPNAALVNDWTVQFAGPGGARRTWPRASLSTSCCPSQNVGPD